MYAASKHAVEGLTKSAALEGAAAGVRVNAISPGPIDTGMLDRFTGSAERKAAFAAGVPAKRLGRPEEIADAIVYLGSGKASYVTGQIIGANGGKTAAGYRPVQYIPRSDVDMSLLQRTDRTTYCPYKGDSAHYSVPAGGGRSVNAVWTYEAPYAAVAAIKHHLAFYPDRVDTIEERAEARDASATVRSSFNFLTLDRLLS